MLGISCSAKSGMAARASGQDGLRYAPGLACSWEHRVARGARLCVEKGSGLVITPSRTARTTSMDSRPARA